MKPFKVVCIGNEWEIVRSGYRVVPPPIKGEIYTVIGISTEEGHQYYALSEWYPDESDWGYTKFRPVQDIGDQVETHIQELIKKEDLQTISV